MSNAGYAAIVGLPMNYYISPELSFDVSYASPGTQTPLPSYITPSANADYVWDSTTGDLTLTNGTLTFTQDRALSSDTTDPLANITATGPTAVVLVQTNQELAGLTLTNGAQAIVQQSPTATTATLSVGSLTVNSGASLDITNNTVLINSTHTPLPAVQAMVNGGSNGGLWNGSGIISSDVVPNSPGGSNYINDNNNGKKTVGYASPAANNTVPAGETEVKYTEAADFTLDGVVNLSDYLALQGHYLQTGADFQIGDSNGDGVVNLSDYLILQGQYLASLNSATGLSAGATAATAAAAPVSASASPVAAVSQPAAAAVTPPATAASIASLFSDTQIQSDWLGSAGASVID
jgi:hypothetical protein